MSYWWCSGWRSGVVSASTSRLVLADVRVFQDVEPFRVRGHEAVLDPVVHHLDEVAGAIRPAVEVALLRGALRLLASRRPRDVALPGASRLEDRVEPRHDVRLAADHHAVAALEAPDAAARPDVDVVDALRRQLLGAPDVVDVVRVAAVDQDVSLLEERQEVGDRLVGDGRGDHQPDDARLRELLDEVGERRRRRSLSP